MDNRIRRSKRVCCCLACWCCAITRDEKERERERKKLKRQESARRRRRRRKTAAHGIYDPSWPDYLTSRRRSLSWFFRSVDVKSFVSDFFLPIFFYFFPFLSFFDFIISGFYRAPVLLPGRWWLKAAAQTPRRIIYMASAIERYALTN